MVTEGKHCMKITIESLSAVTEETLSLVGVDEQSINIILDTILFANRRGNATHGVGRLPLYVKKIQAGHFNPKDEVEKVSDLGAIALFDAHNGFGQVAGNHAMKLAIEKAKKYGIAAVGVCNSNNFGMAGYFGNMAAKENCAAMIYANAAPAIAPTGGNKTIFGTNPLCHAFPGIDDLEPIILDMATTVAARGKIRLAAKNGERIPLDWAIGPDGQPTDDPNEALKGALLPIGGYKGYGLSMFVDLLAGLLTGSSYAGNVKNLSKMDEDSGNGHLFILIDVQKFMTEDELRARLQNFRSAVKNCGEPGHIRMPGERGYISFDEHEKSVELSIKQIEEVNEIAVLVGAKRRLKYE